MFLVESKFRQGMKRPGCSCGQKRVEKPLEKHPGSNGDIPITTHSTKSKERLLKSTVLFGFLPVSVFVASVLLAAEPIPPHRSPIPPARPVSRSEKAHLDAEAKCKLSCRVEIVESIPENLTFGEVELPMSTFNAWKTLISIGRKEIDIAAYKSSLRGKHVLGDSNPIAQPGEDIFDELVTAGTERQVRIRMVENFPPKDHGDNADGKSLQRRGAVDRRSLHYSKVFGRGTMHSKFLLVDQKHFYLGSANLDWRSLNQKMELGVLITDCPCLGKDMKRIFNSYWTLSSVQNDTTTTPPDTNALYRLLAPTRYNRHYPLTVYHGGVLTDIYLANSPKELNGDGRTWDLTAILDTINNSEKYLYIHVMDYIPMIVYRNPQVYWPVIDDALREAVVTRGVEVKLLAAALHFVPQTLRFLKSLQSISGTSIKGSMEVKIFKVPSVRNVDSQTQRIISRERRTHNKFMVSDDSVVIGTSNWSGDYFFGNTGVAVVVRQRKTTNRPFIQEMRQIFIRDWNSDYAHPLNQYIQACLQNSNSELCEVEKTPFSTESE